MNRSELERPFEAALIKSRKGAFGKSINYVEGTEYIRRLNDAFEAEWSFEIAEHHVYDAEVIVIGKLSAGGITKTAFGGSSITTSNTTGEIVSIADDLKAAATDALKKAASMLGVGLSLYSDPPRDGARQGSRGQSSPRSVPVVPIVPGPRNGTRSRGGNGGEAGDGRFHEPRRGGDGGDGGDGHSRNNGRGNGHDRLSQRQLHAIFAIGRSLEVSADELRRRSMEAFGVGPEALSKGDASAFITELHSMVGGNGASA